MRKSFQLGFAGAIIASLTLAVLLTGCEAEQIPEEVLQEAVTEPANSGTTVSSQYVQNPPYEHDPSEWTIVDLTVTKQEVKDDSADVVTESTIKNDDFEVTQTLQQQFKKTDDVWTLESTEKLDAHAKALVGIKYIPSSPPSDEKISDVSGAKVEFDEDKQACKVTYPIVNDEHDWFLKQAGFETTNLHFDGYQWTIDSTSTDGKYYSPFFGKTIDGVKANTLGNEFNYYLGSQTNSDSCSIKFGDITEKEMNLSLTWSGSRYQESEAESVGGFDGLLHAGEGTTTTFEKKADYFGTYSLGLSDYGFGDEESFVLKKSNGDSDMPNEITCVFKYPDRKVSTRYLYISWESDGTDHEYKFELNP